MAGSFIIADVFIAETHTDEVGDLRIGELLVDTVAEAQVDNISDASTDHVARVDVDDFALAQAESTAEFIAANASLFAVGDSFAEVSATGLAAAKGDSAVEISLENSSENDDVEITLQVFYAIDLQTDVAGWDSGFAEAIAFLSISLDAPGDLLSVWENAFGNEVISIIGEVAIDVQLAPGEDKTLLLEALTTTSAEIEPSPHNGAVVTVLAGASGAPDVPVDFEIVINGVTHGMFAFAEQTSVARNFRKNAPIEEFVVETDFQAIDTIAIVFDEVGRIDNSGFDENLLFDRAIIDAGSADQTVLVASENGFYDAAAARGLAANSGGMWWDGVLTLTTEADLA